MEIAIQVQQSHTNHGILQHTQLLPTIAQWYIAHGNICNINYRHKQTGCDTSSKRKQETIKTSGCRSPQRLLDVYCIKQ